MQRIAGIAPLRALAAFLVLVSHVAFWTGGNAIDVVGRLAARGDCGVAVFFALSAYLLTRAACDGDAPQPSRVYWRRRTARILPAYWLALGGVLVVSSMTREGIGGTGRILAHVLLAQGYTGDYYRGFTQTWSLTTEVTFYALVPLIRAWLRRCTARGRSPVAWLLGIAVLSVAVQAWSASSGNPRLGVVSTSVVGHAAWFCAGIAWAWLTTGRQRPLTSRVSAARWAACGATLYLLAATPLAGPVTLHTPGLLGAASKEALYAAIAWCLIAAATTTRAPWTSHPSAQRAGDLSYAIFLWHLLVIQVLFITLDLRLFHAPFTLVLIPTTVISWLLAALSWRWVEHPAIVRAHRPAAHTGERTGRASGR